MTPGILFVDRYTSAHVPAEASRLLGIPCERLLSSLEVQALDGQATRMVSSYRRSLTMCYGHEVAGSNLKERA